MKPSNHTRFTPPDRAVQMADKAIAQMAVWCTDGLPAPYGGRLEAALRDWFMDFPWNAGAKASFKHVLENHGETLDLVQAKFGHNLRADILEVFEDKDGYFAKIEEGFAALKELPRNICQGSHRPLALFANCGRVVRGESLPMRPNGFDSRVCD